MMAYLEAENAYTDAVMKPAAALAGHALQGDARAHQGDGRSTSPTARAASSTTRARSRASSTRSYCRKHGSLDAPEEVTLDLNALAEGQTFMALGAYAVSDDGTPPRLLDRQHRVPPVHAVREGSAHGRAPGADRVEKVGSVAWAADDQTLFYSTEDAARSGRTGCTATRSAPAPTSSSTRRRTSVQHRGRRTRSRALPVPEHRQPHHVRGALPARGRAGGAWTARRPARARPGVRRRSLTASRRSTSAPTTRPRNFRLVTAPVAIPGRETGTRCVAAPRRT